MNFFKSGIDRLKEYRMQLKEQQIYDRVMEGFLATELGDRWVARASERNKLMRQMNVGRVARQLGDVEAMGIYDRTDASYKLGFRAVWMPGQKRLAGQDRVEVLGHKDNVIVGFDEFGARVIYAATMGSFGHKVTIDRREEYVPVPPDIAERVN